MTSDQTPHCCSTNKCTGKTYFGWSLACRFCHKDIMIDCLRSQDESRTKTLLHLYGLIKKTSSTDSTKYEIVKDEGNFKMLKGIFDSDSPFGLTCQVCSAKIISTSISTNVHHQQSATTSGNNEADILSTATDDKSKTAATNNSLNKSVNLLDMSFKDFNDSITDSFRNVVKDLADIQLPSTSKVTLRKHQFLTNKPSKHMEPNSSGNGNAHQIPTKISPKDGVYAIHISKFPKDSTIDDVVSVILDKTDLHTNSFKVEKMSISKIRGKHRDFSSFKVSTWFQEVGEKIIDSNVWSPNYIASPFKHIDVNLRTNKLKSSVKSTPKPKPNQTKPNDAPQRNTHNTPNQKRNNQQQSGKHLNSKSKQNGHDQHHNGQSHQMPDIHHHQNQQQDHQNYQNHQINSPFCYHLPYFYPPPTLIGLNQQHQQFHQPNFHPLTQQAVGYHQNWMSPFQQNAVY